MSGQMDCKRQGAAGAVKKRKYSLESSPSRNNIPIVTQVPCQVIPSLRAGEHFARDCKGNPWIAVNIIEYKCQMSLYLSFSFMPGFMKSKEVSPPVMIQIRFEISGNTDYPPKLTQMNLPKFRTVEKGWGAIALCKATMVR